MLRKKDLVKDVAANYNITVKQSRLIVNGIIKEVVDSLEKGESVNLAGFGTFSIEEREGRMGRNPQTGEKLYIEPKKVIRFDVCNSLKDRIRRDGQK